MEAFRFEHLSRRANMRPPTIIFMLWCKVRRSHASWRICSAFFLSPWMVRYLHSAIHRTTRLGTDLLSRRQSTTRYHSCWWDSLLEPQLVQSAPSLWRTHRYLRLLSSCFSGALCFRTSTPGSTSLTYLLWLLFEFMLHACVICRRDEAIRLQLVLWFLLDRDITCRYSTRTDGRVNNQRLFRQPPVGKAEMCGEVNNGIAVAAVADVRFPWRNSMELRHNM